MNFKIAVIKGDGIGPEIIDGALCVLNKICENFGHQFDYEEIIAGGCAIDLTGVPISDETIEKCKKCDSVLLGAVGGPKWEGIDAELRPEKALLRLRGDLELFANLRPATLSAPLLDSSPLKSEIRGDKIDILIVRELTGGIYFGERENGFDFSSDTEKYYEYEIRRIAKVGFERAQKRNKKLLSVDKANVLDSSLLWRKIINETAKEYPDVTVSHMYVDNAAMQLVLHPENFCTVVTTNMFGDILSDLSAAITGSIGLLPSASIGSGKFGMYEPIHGSAPDIAGSDTANPIATILSAAMMLEISFDLYEEAKAIRNAVSKALFDGYRTQDIMCDNAKLVGTKQMSEIIANNI